MTDQLLTIRRYWNLDEARRAKSILDSACIMSCFENVCFVMMTPHIVDPAGIALKVKSSDAQKAKEILAPQIFVDYLPIAVLTSTDSESLVLQLWREPATEYTNFVAVLSSPQTRPAMEQEISTFTYSLNDAAELFKLLDGDTSIRFSLSAIGFGLTIGKSRDLFRPYIVEVSISTIKSFDHAPWPSRIENYLRDDRSAAGHLQFAFLCEYEALNGFAKQLREMIRKTNTRNHE